MLSAFVVAAGISLLANPPAAWFARRIQWVSSTTREGIHPAMSGGSVILVALIGGIVLTSGLQGILDLKALWLGLGFMFCMGLVDDAVALRPGSKFGLQLLGGGVFILALILERRLALGLEALFILGWILAVSNAINLLDNMDGLAAGVGAIAGYGLASALFLKGGGDPMVTITLGALSGGLVGFLVYNFYPARTFLGDSGSHLIGFVLSATVVQAWIASPMSRSELSGAVLILAVPLLDMGYVVVARTLRRVPFYQGGKDHLSHELQRLGLSTRVVALIFYLLTVSSCTVALLLTG